VVNLYALRATDPKALRGHNDPFGPENEYWLRKVAREYGDVVCAWGANADQIHASKVSALFVAGGARLWCLGKTKDGSPRHPLYVRGEQPLEAFQ
jgi:hypothetical protein